MVWRGRLAPLPRRTTVKHCTSLMAISLLVTLMAAGHATAQDCVESPAGLVGWWPGDGNANDILGDNSGTPFGGISFAPGKVGDAFSFDGIDDHVKISRCQQSRCRCWRWVYD